MKLWINNIWKVYDIMGHLYYIGSELYHGSILYSKCMISWDLYYNGK